MRKLNPFAHLTRAALLQAVEDHRLKRAAEQRVERLVTSYKELIADPRYSPITSELRVVMADQLRLLVEQATKCKHCHAYANRIQTMQEFIAEPLETVWFEQQQEERVADEADADTTETPDE